MHRIRSKHACHAGCCARDLCGDEALPLTQETLAQLMGVQRNAISLVAHALQRAGIIRYSRGYIDITNSGSLK
jgi:Mn-dependent DtxR family transcriptional regulator